MLGLSLHTLAIPDYELISRLEQLILANQANVSAAVALESTLVSSDLGDGFQAGYSRAGRVLAGGRARGIGVVAPPANVTSVVQRHKVEAGLCWILKPAVQSFQYTDHSVKRFTHSTCIRCSCIRSLLLIIVRICSLMTSTYADQFL